MASAEKTSIINVCLIPSSEVSQHFVELSQNLQSPETLFVLGDDKFAHSTVFMARFADSEIPYVLEAVEKAAAFQEFKCQHNGYLLTPGGYLEASYHLNPSLLLLHEMLVNALSPLRFQPGKPLVESYFAPYSAEQQRNAEKTGYDLAHHLYRPHITLTRYKEDRIPEEFPAFAASRLSFLAQQCSVYKADENGAVYHPLADFALQGN